MNPSEAFDELDKLIFCKIWDEKKARKVGEPYDLQIFSVAPKANEKEEERKQRENKQLSERIKALYEEGRRADAEVFKQIPGFEEVPFSKIGLISPAGPVGLK